MSERDADATEQPSAGRYTVSVVAPCYNDSGGLHELVRRIKAALPNDKPEIIIVNDGSQDDTADVLDALTTDDPDVVAISLMRNFGQHNATLAGIRQATAPICVTMDSDLQHRPEDIPRLVELVRRGADVAYATPARDPSPIRYRLSRWTKTALRVFAGVEFASYVSAFRAFKTELRRTFADHRSPFVSIDVLLSWGARRTERIEVQFEQRNDGRSSYSVMRLVKHAVNLITGFSVRPLQLASVIGLATTLIGFLFFVLTIINYFWRGGGVAGFSTIMVLMTMFAGVQLLMLGIIGEYLSRIYIRLMDRPTYVVRTIDRSEP